MARKRPNVDYFGDLAAEYSVEGSSRALRGEMPPIAKHCGQPQLEKEAFALQPGELSGVIQLVGSDKCVILFCEGYTKPEVVNLAQVRDLIEEDVRNEETAAGDVRVVRATRKTRPRSTISSPQRPSRRSGAAARATSACPTSARRRRTAKDSDCVRRESAARGGRVPLLRRSSEFAAFFALLLRSSGTRHAGDGPAGRRFPRPPLFSSRGFL